jgi:hypothetical protein
MMPEGEAHDAAWGAAVTLLYRRLEPLFPGDWSDAAAQEHARYGLDAAAIAVIVAGIDVNTNIREVSLAAQNTAAAVAAASSENQT